MTRWVAKKNPVVYEMLKAIGPCPHKDRDGHFNVTLENAGFAAEQKSYLKLLSRGYREMRATQRRSVLCPSTCARYHGVWSTIICIEIIATCFTKWQWEVLVVVF